MSFHAEHYMPERYAVTEKQHEVAQQFVGAVSADLCANLSTKARAPYEGLDARAVEMLLYFKVTPEYLDATNPAVWERGALLLGMAHLWDESFHPNGVAREDIRKWLSLLIPQKVRQKQLLEPEEAHPFAGAERIHKELLRRAWPKSNGDHAWVAQHIAQDHLAVLPYSSRVVDNQRSLMGVVWEIAEDFGLRAVPFEGVAFPEHKFGIVPLDASPYLRQHEKEHAENANLIIGDLGDGLNEGETVRRVLEKIEPDTEESFVYGSELSLITHLRKDEEMGTLISNRYEQLSDATVKPLATKMIEQYGPEGHVLLYVANSAALSRGDYIGTTDGASRRQKYPYVLYQEATGLIPTSLVVHRLWYDTNRAWQ